MSAIMLPINKIAVADEPVIYTCYGLGSCVGLFISDRKRNISAGAHIAVAWTESGEPSSTANLFDELFDRLKKCGSTLQNLSAKLTGGAAVYSCSIAVGDLNIRAVREELINRKVFIAAHDVGGHVSRTARYNSATRELTISTSEKKTYSI